MDPRKMRILQAVTDDYISTAEPVGSRTIARKYGLGVSPATIRNEMSDLEELGYLEQPHTSAGRVPSDKGYRFYVDVLMDPVELSPAEREHLREELLSKQRAMEQTIHRAARLLSALTHYAAVVVAPRPAETAVRGLHLTPLDECHVLAVLVTEPGFVENHVIELPAPMSDEELDRLATRLNEFLRGKTLRQVTRGFLSRLREEIDSRSVYDETVELLMNSLGSGSEERVYLEGALNLFEQPEFRDVERAKPVLGFLEQEEAVASMLSGLCSRAGTRVVIGQEHSRAEMKECSMVTAAYRIGDSVVGAVGVVGPTRMDYARAVSVVEALAESLSEALSHVPRRPA